MLESDSCALKVLMSEEYMEQLRTDGEDFI
jgi:hypothetical protein